MRRIDYSSRIERCTERSVRITGTRAEALDEERFHVSRDASPLPARSGSSSTILALLFHGSIIGVRRSSSSACSQAAVAAKLVAVLVNS